jgi:hypothetical protein
MRSILVMSIAFVSAVSIGAAFAEKTEVIVSANANIYGAGQENPPGGGVLPPSVSLKAHYQCVSFKRVRGSLTQLPQAATCPTADRCITLDLSEPEHTHLNDPDGVGAYPPTSSNTGYGSISGIKAPFAGYLVGVFVGKHGPKGPAPTALDFTTGAGTGFTTLAPALDQTFFIGDGLTGDDTGNRQTFTVPADAAALYLGISDAGGFNGPPGAYFDNKGKIKVEVHPSYAACPAQ